MGGASLANLGSWPRGWKLTRPPHGAGASQANLPRGEQQPIGSPGCFPSLGRIRRDAFLRRMLSRAAVRGEALEGGESSNSRRPPLGTGPAELSLKTALGSEETWAPRAELVTSILFCEKRGGLPFL